MRWVIHLKLLTESTTLYGNSTIFDHFTKKILVTVIKFIIIYGHHFLDSVCQKLLNRFSFDRFVQK